MLEGVPAAIIGRMETTLRREIEVQRTSMLRRLQAGLDKPLALLGLVWLALTALDLMGRSSPFLANVSVAIWGLFILEFVVRFVLAPHKLIFLRRNLISVVSLALPALRMVRLLRIARVLRFARAARGLRLLRLLTSLNRGLRSLSGMLRRRGAVHVMLVTLMVLFGGAAGMSAFEPELGDYGAALWWTAMLLATMGSDFWPVSPEGRLLCLVLSLYGLSMFGYITAAIATLFVSADAKDRREQGS